MHLCVRTWDNSPLSTVQQVEELLKAGASIIQFHQEKGSPQEILANAREAVRLCNEAKVRIVVEGSPELCRDAGCPFVCITGDETVERAREVLGPGALVACVVFTKEEARARLQEACDVIDLCPWRRNHLASDKDNVWERMEVLEVLQHSVNEGQDKIPIVVSGGIRLEDISELNALRTFAVMVRSRIVGAEDLAAAYQAFHTACRAKRVPRLGLDY
jgi:thiamine-phosphate pyrophosphorylase